VLTWPKLLLPGPFECGISREELLPASSTFAADGCYVHCRRRHRRHSNLGGAAQPQDQEFRPGRRRKDFVELRSPPSEVTSVLHHR
jgi:hypothetical protein